MKTFEIKVTSNGETVTKEVEERDGIYALLDINFWELFDDLDIYNFKIEVKEI